jgi:RNA 2',3'-cyclic 3'-phosphodiesterase
VTRLFIAVDVDESTRAEVAKLSVALRASLQAGLSGVRVTWVRPERLHLTLEFLGESDQALERRAMSVLAEPFPVAPFDLRFEGIGCFPRTGSPRALWLGISSGLGEVCRIHDVVRRRLGVDEQGREAFQPHLTLARVRDRARPAQFGEIAGMQTSAGPCPIDRVTLYESRLSPGGPTYVALAQAALMPCT